MFGIGDRNSEVIGIGDRVAEVIGIGDRDAEVKGIGDRDAEVIGIGDRDAEVIGISDRDAEAIGIGDRDTEVIGIGDRDSEVIGVGDRDAEVIGIGDRNSEVIGIDDHDTKVIGMWVHHGMWVLQGMWVHVVCGFNKVCGFTKYVGSPWYMLPDSPSKISTFVISLIILFNFDIHAYNPVVQLVRDTLKLSSGEVSETSTSLDFSYQDASSCPPCLCFRDMDNVLTADCTNRNLNGVPGGLPVNVSSLDMSRNSLTQFNTASVLNYSHVTSLSVYLNPNLTEVVRTTTDNTSSQLTRLSLSYNSIQYIQPGSFRCHSNLQELILGANKLTNISADMFEGLQSLKFLNLSRNSINHIDNDTFDILESLQSLDLSKNRLTNTNRCFPARIFENLHHLKQLYLHGDLSNNQPFPNEALSKLGQLTHLSLNLNMFGQLDSQVISLKKLTSLSFSSYPGSCNIRNITEDFLENTPHLTTLVICGCSMYHISPLVYANVRNLKTLQISDSSQSYDLFEALDHLQGLVNSSLKTLRLISLAQYVSLFRLLRKEQAKYLQYIALDELDLTHNNIAVICNDFADRLPISLKRLILTGNNLTKKVFKLGNIYFLTHLSEIYLDGQTDELNKNLVTAVNEDVQHNRPHGNFVKMKIKDTEDIMRNNLTLNYTQYDNIPTKKLSDKPCLTSELNKKSHKVPPNLKIVRASRFNLFGTFIFHRDLEKTNSIIDITLKDNFFKTWGQRVLPRKIQRVDLSNNFAKKLNSGFFVHNNSLISLTINNNIFGECFASDVDGEIFKFATELNFLDISLNLITALHRPFFSRLKNLEILLASDNKLQTLNVSLRHMSSLRFMNFSQNSITWIDQSSRDDLDILASTHTVHLDLSYNPLPCTCEGLPILQWMAYTNVNLVNQIYLRCQSEGGTMSNFGDLDARVTQIQRECASRAIILVISISFSVVIVIFTSLALVYRFRWKIRYLRNIALSRFVGFKPKSVLGNNFLYDAYILYDDRAVNFVFRDCIQELEVKRGHRLLLADRDIMPGSIMTSAILSAVQNSYRTIPMVTPDFYDGLYSEYAVKMAVMEEIYGQRQILHLFLHQPTDPEEMPKDLLSILHRNHYTEYPPEPDRTENLVEHFWDQLSGCIQQMK
ncbi:hypothetical protein Btru_064096 [Bulinus truncatus]|nr:hypothetical protein Btru_064096 [Bulinus truncatus]